MNEIGGSELMSGSRGEHRTHNVYAAVAAKCTSGSMASQMSVKATLTAAAACVLGGEPLLRL